MSMLDSNPDSDADDDGRGNTPLETILHRRRTIQMRARQNGRTPLPGAPRERQRTPPLPGIAPIGAERSGPSKELQAGLKSSIKGKKLIGTIGDGRVEDAEVAERTHIYYPQ